MTLYKVTFTDETGPHSRPFECEDFERAQKVARRYLPAGYDGEFSVERVESQGGPHGTE